MIATPLKALTVRWTPSVPDGLVGMKDNKSYFAAILVKRMGITHSIAYLAQHHKFAQNFSKCINSKSIV